MATESKKPARIPNAARSAETRGQLMTAAKALFAEHGFGAVSTEQIVEAAGVTRGALYHHFTDKRDLFRAVFDQMEQDIVGSIAEAVAAREDVDAWSLAVGGSLAFLDQCLDPAVRQIAIIDAQAVLGLEESREIVDRYGGALIQAAVQQLIEAGEIEPQPVEPLARVLTGALIEGGVAIALSSDRAAARREVGDAVERVIRGLAARPAG